VANCKWQLLKSIDVATCWQSSASLPASPYSLYRNSSQFTWRLQPLTPQSASGAGSGARRPLVLPCLENLDLPYADDSAAATPTSDDLCSFQNAQNARTYQRQQRLSTASAGIRLSQLEMRFGGGSGNVSRTGSRASRQSRHSIVASSAAMLSAGATSTQLDVHAPRLKVNHFYAVILVFSRKRSNVDPFSNTVRWLKNKKGSHLFIKSVRVPAFVLSDNNRTTAIDYLEIG